MASSIGSLQISEDKKKYITDHVSPVLEDLVTCLLTEMPQDPLKFCHTWFGEKCGAAAAGGDVTALAKQNEALRQSVLMMAQDEITNKQEIVPAEEEESDESDEDDEEMERAFEAELAANAAKKDHKCNRTSVSAEAYGQFNQKKAFTPPVHPKSDDQLESLDKLLSSCWFFNSLGKDEMKTVLLALVEVNLAANDQPITKGDYGDFMFVIETGTLECWLEIDGAKKVLKTVSTGEIFGELALLYNTTRAAHVSAATECKVWKLDRDTFANIVIDSHQKHREKNMEAIAGIPILSSLDSYQVGQVCDALKIKEYKAGHTIITEGEVGNICYFITAGKLYATKGGERVKEYSESTDRHFGELALLNNAPRAASVICETDCTIMELEKQAFHRLLGDLVEVLRNTSY